MIKCPNHSKLNIHKHLVINAGVLTKRELTVVDEQHNTLNLKAGEVGSKLNQLSYPIK